MYLQRYHDVEISNSGVWRILKRLDLNRLPGLPAVQAARPQVEAVREADARPRRPGRRQVHRAAVAARAGRSTTSSPPSTTAPGCGCCGSTTGSTRRPRSSSPTSCWTSSRSGSRRSRPTTDPNSSRPSTGTWLDRGIRHVYIKPATPRLNGKVERSHRIDGEEFYRQLKGVVIDDTQLFNDKLQEWQDFYNYHRPHGALGGQTPYERLSRRPQHDPRRKRSTSAPTRSPAPTRHPGQQPETSANAALRVSWGWRPGGGCRGERPRGS